MAEYRNYRPDYEEAGEAYINNPPESDYSLEFQVEAKDYVNAGNASSEIKLMLKKINVTPSVIRKIAIASYEAEINVTAHSNGGSVRADFYDDAILITFEDRGPGIKNIEQAMQHGYSTADDLAREMGFGAGLGLPNIQRNSDSLYINSEEGGKTIVKILIFFSGD